MDCKEFRESHFAFVDDTLPGIELVGMQVHQAECPACAAHDATVRRSLMLVKSLPSIEPSPDFVTRLERRLAEARLADETAMRGGRSRRMAAAVAISSALMLGYIGMSLRQVDTASIITFPPVIASAPASAMDGATDGESMESLAPELVASVPAGLPIWTAALLAEQATAHFASMELTSATR